MSKDEIVTHLTACKMRIADEAVNLIEQQAKALSDSQQTVEALMSSNCNMNDTLRSRGFTKGSTEERLIALAQSHDEQAKEIEELLAQIKDLVHKIDQLQTLRTQNERLVKDSAMLDRLLRPSNWLGIAEVKSVKGSATWYGSREAVQEFYKTDPDAIRESNREAKEEAKALLAEVKVEQ